MRRSRNETAASRRRIVTEAARLFRERGIEQVSVANVMAAAGMTHGGFYVHFANKEALVGAAVREAFAEKLDHLVELDDAGRRNALRRYIDGYLTQGHVADLGFGCPIAGLAAEIAHGAPVSRQALAEGASRTLDVLSHDAFGGDRREAIRTFAMMIGAVVLARAVDGSDANGEVLTAVRSSDALAKITG